MQVNAWQLLCVCVRVCVYVCVQMKLLNENVSAIRAAVTGPGGLSGSGYMWRSSYLSLTLLAAASAGTVWYLRSKQRSA